MSTFCYNINMSKELTILYLHGFASVFNPDSNKVKALSKLGKVVGFDIDYAKTRGEIEEDILRFVYSNDIDLIVGCSMGGYNAINIGAATGIPCVALNPALFPERKLKERVGKTVANYVTKEKIVITEDHVKSYNPFDKEFSFETEAFCLVLVDEDDDVIDAQETFDILAGTYECIMFKGGSHRFEHMEEALPFVTELLDRAEAVYGLENS